MKDRIVKIADFVIYWSIIIIPFSILIAPGAAFTFIGLMTFCFLLKKIITKQRLFANSVLNLPFFILLAVALVSFKNSISYSDSFHGIGKMVLNGFIFLIAAEEIKTRKHIQLIFISIVCGAGLASIDAIWQLKFGADFIQHRELKYAIGLTRATASFPNSNVFGVYISAIAPMVVGMSLFYFKKQLKAFMLALSALVTFGVVSTFSRGTGLGFFLAVIIASIAKRSKVIIASLVILLILSPFIAPQKIKDWVKSIHYNPVVFMLNADRISIYRNSLNMIRHHPVIGVGVNTFCRNYLTYKLPEPEGAKSAEHMYSHNNFLEMAGELGLVGLAVFLWFLFRLFKQAVKNYKLIQDNFLKTICLCAAVSIISFLVNGMTETSLYYSRVSMIFWYLVGFSLALKKFTDEKCIS